MILRHRGVSPACLSSFVQEQVARKAANGESREIYDAIAKVHRDMLMARRCVLPMEGTDYQLLCGDFRKVGRKIPPGSVDLLVTDAPYERGYLHLFEPLSLFANRMLREGGSLVVMVGQYHLPKILNDLTAHLRYHWMFVTMMTQRRSLVHHRMVFAGYKPLLWFCKGEYRGTTGIQDVIRCGGYDKNFHDHGQPEADFAHILGRLSLGRVFVCEIQN